MFMDLNEDSYTPMKIVCMVELSDCRAVCGGSVVAEDGVPIENKDTCIAIAGLPSNNTVSVKKYCIPKAMGESVRREPSEDWNVWFSEEWSSTILDIQFSDTVVGDMLIVHRDNRGHTLDTGPLEQFVSVHPRYIQDNARTFDLQYSTSAER